MWSTYLVSIYQFDNVKERFQFHDAFQTENQPDHFNKELRLGYLNLGYKELSFYHDPIY